MDQPKSFRFTLKQQVVITCSGEVAEVIARAEYSNSENNYYVRYRAADGRATETWWCESALSAA